MDIDKMDNIDELDKEFRDMKELCGWSDEYYEEFKNCIREARSSVSKNSQSESNTTNSRTESHAFKSSETHDLTTSSPQLVNNNSTSLDSTPKQTNTANNSLIVHEIFRQQENCTASDPSPDVYCTEYTETADQLVDYPSLDLIESPLIENGSSYSSIENSSTDHDFCSPSDPPSLAPKPNVSFGFVDSDDDDPLVTRSTASGKPSNSPKTVMKESRNSKYLSIIDSDSSLFDAENCTNDNIPSYSTIGTYSSSSDDDSDEGIKKLRRPKKVTGPITTSTRRNYLDLESSVKESSHGHSYGNSSDESEDEINEYDYDDGFLVRSDEEDNESDEERNSSANSDSERSGDTDDEVYSDSSDDEYVYRISPQEDNVSRSIKNGKGSNVQNSRLFALLRLFVGKEWSDGDEDPRSSRVLILEEADRDFQIAQRQFKEHYSSKQYIDDFKPIIAQASALKSKRGVNKGSFDPFTYLPGGGGPYLLKSQEKKNEIVRKLFKEYNTLVFNSQLRHDLPLKWNASFRTTGGMATYQPANHTRYARDFSKPAEYDSENRKVRWSFISLSPKVLTTAQRIATVLLHEMCHSYVWEHWGCTVGHGTLFKKIGRKASSLYPSREVQTFHDYNIAYKFPYLCVDCGGCIKRHSKSIDTTKKVCGRCRGQLRLACDVPLGAKAIVKGLLTVERLRSLVNDMGREYAKNALVNRGSESRWEAVLEKGSEEKLPVESEENVAPSSTKKPSQYQIFCQEKRAELKLTEPHLSAKEIMVRLGEMWNKHKEEMNIPTVKSAKTKKTNKINSNFDEEMSGILKKLLL